MLLCGFQILLRRSDGKWCWEVATGNEGNSELLKSRSSLGNVLKYIAAISVKGCTKFCGIGGTIYEFWMHTEVN